MQTCNNFPINIIFKQKGKCKPSNGKINLKIKLTSNKSDKKRPVKRKLKSVKRDKSAEWKVGRPKKVVQFHGLETITRFFRSE